MPADPILRDIYGNVRFVIKVTDITSFEEDLSDRIRDKMKAWIQSILLLGNYKQKVVTNGYPYLRVDCVHSRAVEGFDVQMLLDPLEEQLNLPSLAIEFGNGYGIQREVVSQEAIDSTVSKVLIDNESEVVGILSAGVKACEPDSLVRDEPGLRINLAAINDFILHVVLGSGDKPCMILMKMGVKRIKLDITFVHQIIGVRLNRHFIKNLGIVNRSLCKTDKCRDGAVEIHQSMHLDSSLAMMKRSPWTEGKAQFNSATVKCTDHLVKVYSQLLAGIKVLRLLYQNVAKVLIDTPIALLIGFCKGGFGHYFQSRPIQVLRAKVKCGLNISQAASVRELSKAHRKELVPAIELDGVPVTFVATNTLAEFIFGKERHKLCEDCFTLVHSLRETAQMPLRKLTSSNRKIILSL